MKIVSSNSTQAPWRPPGGAGQRPLTSFDRLVEKAYDVGLTVQHLRDDDVMVACPAHEDTTPSLHVTYDVEAGCMLVYCFAGCEVTDVLAGLDLTLGDLYDRPGRKSRSSVARGRVTHPICGDFDLGHLTDRADQQARIESSPAWWWRRAVELALVGTGWASEASRACSNHFAVLSGGPS